MVPSPIDSKSMSASVYRKVSEKVKSETGLDGEVVTKPILSSGVCDLDQSIKSKRDIFSDRNYSACSSKNPPVAMGFVWRKGQMVCFATNPKKRASFWY